MIKKYGFQALHTNYNHMINNYYGNKTLEQYQALPEDQRDPYRNMGDADAMDKLAMRLRDVNSTLASQFDINDIGLLSGIGRAVNSEAAPEYLDQLLPFNVSILFLNESGSRARMELLGVEILNEGMSMGVDDVQLEKALTFVARRVNM